MKSRNGKGPIKAGEEITLSSGVVVTVLPIPPGLIQQIQRDYPDLVPPKKTITVLGGTEEVDNLSDPQYKQGQATIERERNSKLGEAVVEFCLECDLSKYEPTIKRLEKIVSAYPTDPDERRVRFLLEYALKTVGDYSITQAIAIEQISFTDEEVRERIASFQTNLARAAANGTETPGADEGQRLEMEQPQT